MQVTILAQKVRNESAFTMTIKRCKYINFKLYRNLLLTKSSLISDDGIDKATPNSSSEPVESSENLCLIRMKAKSKKITTVVKATDVSKLMESYGKVMKANMDGLKKVKRVKNKSSKAMQL